MSYQPKNANGQATMANSEPVVIASNQSTIPVSIASVPSHNVTNAGTFAVQVSSIPAVTGTVEIGATSLAALETISAIQSGTWNVTNVSGTVSLPTGASTTANQTTIIGHLDGVEGLLTTIDADTGSIMTSVQLLDDTVIADNTSIGSTKLVAVGGTDGTNSQMLSVNASGHVNIADGGNSITVDGTFWQATQPVSTASLPLPTGAATESTLSTLNGKVTAVNTGAVTISTALPAGTNNIGDMDILSVPAPLNVIGTGAAATALRVHLSDESLTALENISVTIPGIVDLGTVSLTAIETITVNDGGGSLTVDNGTLSTVGGGLEATALRVTIATDSTGVVSIDDNGSSLTVDGTVAATQSGTWGITNISGTVSLPTGASTGGLQTTGNAILTTIDADTGGILTSVQLLDDTVTTDGATIGTTKLLMVGGYDGTNAQYISTNSTGHINIADGGNSITVDGTFWQATQPVSLASVPSHAVTNAGTFAVQATLAAETTKVIGTINIAAAQTLATVTTVGAVTSITNALPAGTNAIGKLAANSGVDIGDVDITSVITGTGATNLGKAVDNAAGATDTGVLLLAVRDDALDTLTPVDNDYTQLRTNSTGRLWTSTVLDTAIPAGTNNIGDVDILSIAAGDNNIGNVDIVTLPSLPSGSNTIGAVNIAAAQTLSTVTTVGTVTNLSQMGGVTINLAAGTSATGTQRVVIGSAATGTQSNPSLSTTSATVLAASTARIGASIYNDSNYMLYLRLSATAVTTSVFTVKLGPEDYYEVPSNYNGAITGLLDSGTTTLVQVTQVT